MGTLVSLVKMARTDVVFVGAEIGSRRGGGGGGGGGLGGGRKGGGGGGGGGVQRSRVRAKSCRRMRDAECRRELEEV